MKWKSLQIPKVVQRDEKDYTETYGRFVVEPLERGYGVTLGNSLRRVLLSSLQGAACVSVKIDGVQHEYTTIKGVTEDVSELVLNLKKLRVKLLADHNAELKLDVHGDGEVTAARFEGNADVEILNPDLHICTVNKDANLKLTVKIEDGRGYVPAEKNKKDGSDVGTIFMDSIFSPVVNANFIVEDTRVGQQTDYDKLILEIRTDGSLSPEDALSYAAKILSDHLNPFITFECEFEKDEESDVDEEKDRIVDLLNMRVDELELSVRSSNCLRSANIHTIANLVKNQESEMLHYKNFGRKSLVELNQVLNGMGLSFGMDVESFLQQKSKTN